MTSIYESGLDILKMYLRSKSELSTFKAVKVTALQTGLKTVPRPICGAWMNEETNEWMNECIISLWKLDDRATEHNEKCFCIYVQRHWRWTVVDHRWWSGASRRPSTWQAAAGRCLGRRPGGGNRAGRCPPTARRPSASDSGIDRRPCEHTEATPAEWFYINEYTAPSSFRSQEGSTKNDALQWFLNSDFAYSVNNNNNNNNYDNVYGAVIMT